MKCLNTRAKIIALKLYESMYQEPYMIEEGLYSQYLPTIMG